MPVYEYRCQQCGDFTAIMPMARSGEPYPCPACGIDAARMISAPALGRLNATVYKAHAINERSAHAPRGSRDAESASPRKHGAGCGCCGGSLGGTKTVKAQDGSKMFPAKRPWMISH